MTELDSEEERNNKLEDRVIPFVRNEEPKEKSKNPRPEYL